MNILLTEVQYLEKDPYAADETLRKRSYGSAIILLWDADSVHWLPTVKRNGKDKSGYDQG
ncbi:hypothetical protein LU631_21045 [Erwinia tracheiphila]|nr:hypothetical protein [Erwinia tracheiphila]UIA87217.1 hypothetical protein LU631_21045 [Erwinia tracheiphila]UIA92848.1 hypothetical protein LU632_04205 [Erwinia tracheiphila]UIA95579.1 hypothetical protein LU633_19495 [Erwinia tracheiphila]